MKETHVKSWIKKNYRKSLRKNNYVALHCAHEEFSSTAYSPTILLRQKSIGKRDDEMERCVECADFFLQRVYVHRDLFLRYFDMSAPAVSGGEKHCDRLNSALFLKPLHFWLADLFHIYISLYFFFFFLFESCAILIAGHTSAGSLKTYTSDLTS